MVEVTKLRITDYGLRILFAFVLLMCACFASGQQRTIIAGLEENAEYRALTDEEGALVRSADSLAAEIASLRVRLRADTLGYGAISAAIVGMEEQSFEIRSRMARLAGRINTMEQEWILASLAGESAGDEAAPGHEARSESESAARRRPGNAAYGSWFESGLSPDEMRELQEARETEGEIPRLAAQYRRDHERLAALAREYDAAPTAAYADSIRAEFDTASDGIGLLDGQITRLWETVFDSRSYLYNLLADKKNRQDLLAIFEAGMERIREEKARWSDQGTPESLLDHALQKRMLADYETALAREIGDEAAADSLRRIAAALPGPASLDGLGPVKLKKRLFLDYADIAVGGSPYNASNPIPEVKVWPGGVIWRVQVGNFASRQAPSIFRGAHPVAVQSSDDGRFRYFAGGFKTDSLAAAAVERLRRAGFRAPSAVVWMDGVLIDPAAETPEKIYRVEISGAEELSTDVREVIAAATDGGVDIVRGTDGFIVAPLDGAVAVRLRTALDALLPAYPGVEARLTKIEV